MKFCSECFACCFAILSPNFRWSSFQTNDGQIEKTDSSSNDDKALCQDSHIVDIERKDCLNIFNSNEGCVAQTVEECSKIGITNSSDNDDTGNQKQKDEYQKDENKVLDSAVKAHMQGMKSKLNFASF